MQKGFTPILIIFLIAVLAGGIGVGGFLIGKNSSQKPQPIASPSPTTDQKACTQEAKLCPNGTSVSRTGSNCEFAACLTIDSSVVDGFKTYQGAGFTIQYPEGFIVQENKTNRWAKFSKDEITRNKEQKSETILISYKETEIKDPCLIKVDGYPNAKCISINGIRMLDWQSETANVGPLMFTYSAINKGLLYEIDFLDMDGQRKDQILKNFKFTD